MGSKIFAAAVAALAIIAPAHAGSDLGFDLKTVLSKRAAAELGRRKEGVIVSASYYGDPLPSAQRHANEVGQIDLGRETMTLRGLGGPIHVSGANVETKRLGWLKGPPMVNVNVFTARRSSQNNLINCDFIDGEVARVAAQPITLHCALIGEARDTIAYPR
ncbi:hypothetical protein FJQ54_03500 [Sandaracinobacter neustonicus]|uniref:Uncharacterized protein n=1 Tax=Sandaracinobacter neustonicus TaxID=1715348 RepID=A0A501XTZ3_9SPHN|nr:hypothetical protein [Sandaracinobacter neustonicus]TPE63919.1 hypothetical protein FJQ54_03500 [Sandaracinobacter neustonicus]